MNDGKSPVADTSSITSPSSPRTELHATAVTASRPHAARSAEGEDGFAPRAHRRFIGTPRRWGRGGDPDRWWRRSGRRSLPPRGRRRSPSRTTTVASPAGRRIPAAPSPRLRSGAGSSPRRPSRRRAAARRPAERSASRRVAGWRGRRRWRCAQLQPLHLGDVAVDLPSLRGVEVARLAEVGAKGLDRRRRLARHLVAAADVAQVGRVVRLRVAPLINHQRLCVALRAKRSRACRSSALGAGLALGTACASGAAAPAPRSSSEATPPRRRSKIRRPPFHIFNGSGARGLGGDGATGARCAGGRRTSPRPLRSCSFITIPGPFPSSC